MGRTATAVATAGDASTVDTASTGTAATGGGATPCSTTMGALLPCVGVGSFRRTWAVPDGASVVVEDPSYEGAFRQHTWAVSSLVEAF
jgi:hypothetical protein